MDENDNWIFEDNAIRSLFVQYYQDLFSSAGPRSISFHNQHSYGQISEEDKNEAPAVTEEVRRALFSMANYKAPGPDGYHPFFFKAKWEVLGDCIVNFVK